MSILIFIVILAALVFVHELGHFIVAKSSGIRVDEFGLGFPPKIFAKKYGETIYSLNSIPCGGFVKIFGETPTEESISGQDSARSFVNKSKWIQSAVLVAGVTFNILFAWLLISLGFFTGLPTPAEGGDAARIINPGLTITSVLPGSPAEEAKLRRGDVITTLASGGEKLETPSVQGAQDFISESKEDVTLALKRGKEVFTKTIAPSSEIVPGKQAIGISMDMIGILRLGFFESFLEGAKTTASLTLRTAEGLWYFIKDALVGRADFSQVTGPVGIVGLVGEESALGFIYIISFTAFISINLAIINLIPFPALDGGRLLFVLIEAVKGSPIKSSIANKFNAVGFVLLLLLMAAVTYNDIVKLL